AKAIRAERAEARRVERIAKLVAIADGNSKLPWGFEYKTHVVWVKDWIGVGFWVHNQHEILLVAARGDMPTPAPANRPPSVIIAPRREHSRKPDEAYVLIERMYPDLPKIELFARQTRPGWAAWGNQVGTAA